MLLVFVIEADVTSEILRYAQDDNATLVLLIATGCLPVKQ